MVSLDSELTKDLKEEGVINDFLRKYRDFRKKEGLRMGDMIDVKLSITGELASIIKEFVKGNEDELHVNSVEFVEELEDSQKEFVVDETKVRIKA